MYLNV